MTPARPKQRALLAMLLLRRAQVVPGARLIEALWGEEPPGTAQTALHGHVSSLRKLIGADRIKTRPPGYLLQVAEDEVDAARFESLVARARERDDPRERVALLRDALALWHGEPLAELRGEPHAEREIARLEALRLATLEDRIDADLAFGRQRELVAELEPLVAEHVFRERLRGQLMLALYRCGRQADALHVFQTGRRTLVEQLGIEPGPALQQLQLHILRHDPSLELAALAPRSAPVRYARSGDVNLAYQVVGEGPVDVVYVPGWVSNVELNWEDPSYARFLTRLASFSRLILFDKRGTGLSDRVQTDDLPTLEQRMDDVRAVMDAVGSRRAALVGTSEGGPMCALFAATYPDRTTSLVMYGGYARGMPDGDYHWGVTRLTTTPEDLAAMVDALSESWGEPTELLGVWGPSIAEDERRRRWFARYLRMSASPAAAVALARMNHEVDIRPVLPTIGVPTLVVHRAEDTLIPCEGSRYMADRIPGARYVELPGADHLWFLGDLDALMDEIEEFLTGTRQVPEHDRVLATVMFTDIVGSTERAATLGDRGWRELLASHENVVRTELKRFRGREVKTTGDGFLATFDGPARGIRCARAICEGVQGLGIEIRAGLHAGECELLDGDVTGIAVHTAARVSSEATAGEVLVSSTVKDLVAGSGIEFRDRGTRTLRGIPGEWRLFAVAA